MYSGVFLPRHEGHLGFSREDFGQKFSVLLCLLPRPCQSQEVSLCSALKMWLGLSDEEKKKCMLEQNGDVAKWCALLQLPDAC